MKCNPHPLAPHGFDRNGSHNADRYVCDCESWIPEDTMMNKEKIFRELYRQTLVRDEWFDKLPTDICAAFFDNVYTNSLSEECDMLIKIVFGEHTEAIQWFLWEWKPGFEVGCDGVTAVINNIDEYIDWLKKHEGFE